MHQLQPLPKFTRDMSGEGGTVVEWLEHFELIGTAYHWNESAKLVNLVTHLKGQTFAFYGSCDTRKQSDYPTLVQKLRNQFTQCTFWLCRAACFTTESREDMDTYAPVQYQVPVGGDRCLRHWAGGCPGSNKRPRQYNQWHMPVTLSNHMNTTMQ